MNSIIGPGDNIMDAMIRKLLTDKVTREESGYVSRVREICEERENLIKSVKDKMKLDMIKEKDDAIEKKLKKIEKKTKQSVKTYKNAENTRLMGFMLTSIMMSSNNPLMNLKPQSYSQPKPPTKQVKSALTPQTIIDN